MHFSTLTLAAIYTALAAAANPRFQAFSTKNCGGSALGIKSQKALGNGATCFTLDSAAHSFDADTDGCVFSSFTGAGCTGTQGLLEQGSCDEKLGAFKSVQQGCS
jgi:hypothetical protein